jgi:hypothetical protein
MCTTLQTNAGGAERVANIDRRTATYVAGAMVRMEGVQLDLIMDQTFYSRRTL